MGSSSSLMSSISFLNEQACSGRNITWQYIHHGHLPLLDETQYNVLSFPKQTLYNYSACPNAEAILHLHGCWNGACHPNRWNHEFRRYAWKNWNGLNDPRIVMRPVDTKSVEDGVPKSTKQTSSLRQYTEFWAQELYRFFMRARTCTWRHKAQEGNGGELSHRSKKLHQNRQDLKKRVEQVANQEEDNLYLSYRENELERRSHDTNGYPNPSYPGPSLSNPSRPRPSPRPRILNFGSRHDESISTGKNQVRVRDEMREFHQADDGQEHSVVGVNNLAELA